MNALKCILVIFIMNLLMISGSHAGYQKPIKAIDYLEVKWKISRIDGDNIVRSVQYYAEKRKIDPYLIMAIIEKESSYRRKSVAPSKSIGLMQIQAYWHKKIIKGRDLFVVRTNVEVGTQILSECIKKRKTLVGALMCYNGGGDPRYHGKVIAIRDRLVKSILL